MALSTHPDVSSVPAPKRSSSAKSLLSGIALAAAMAVQPSAQATPVIAPSMNSLATAPETLNFSFAYIARLNVGQGGSAPMYFVRPDFTYIILDMTFQPLTVSDATQPWGSGSYKEGEDTYSIALDALSVSRQEITDRPVILTQLADFSGDTFWDNPNNIFLDSSSIDLTRTTNTPTNNVPEAPTLPLVVVAGAGLFVANRWKNYKPSSQESKTV